MATENSTFGKPGERLCTRLFPLPVGVPFGLRSVGRIELPPGGCTPPRTIGFVQLVWSVAGTGCASIDGTDYAFPPWSTAVFLPGSRHCLRAGSEPWEYRWITLDGPSAVLVVSSLGLEAAPVPSGPCPDALFDELEEAVLAIGPDREVRATVPAYRLLVEATCARGRSPHPPQWSQWAETVRRLFAAHLADTEVGIAQVAEMVGLDRSTLTSRFKQAAGICPKEYLTALRLQRAMALLRTTDSSVADIASQCGFSCANYFIKAFAKRVGITPLRYRRRAV